MLIVVEELFLCVGQVVDWRRILRVIINKPEKKSFNFDMKQN